MSSPNGPRRVACPCVHICARVFTLSVVRSPFTTDRNLTEHTTDDGRTDDDRTDGPLAPGTLVRDRDDDHASDAVVIRRRDDPADEVTVPIDGTPTVAEVNPDYPSDAAVVKVAFTDALDRVAPSWSDLPAPALLGLVARESVATYDYPEPRLRRAVDGGA